MRLTRWERDVRRQIVEEILYANHGRWPRRKAEWVAVARRFGFEVYFYAGPIERARLSAETIHLARGRATLRWQRVTCHEVAEACTYWEGTPAYVVPARYADNARHRIARTLERHIRRCAV